jgi:nitrous oxidase accessory protein
VFRRNIIAKSDVAVVLYDSVERNRFEGNAFIGNLSPLLLVGRRTDTVFNGNYWSEDREPDLNGDGIRDRPYRLSNVFDHLRGNLTAADLMAGGAGATVLAAAEDLFPVLAPVSVVDSRPLVAVPPLSNVPPLSAVPRSSAAGGVALSLLYLAGGGAVLWAGRRRALAW